jgi:hypothetical protein
MKTIRASLRGCLTASALAVGLAAVSNGEVLSGSKPQPPPAPAPGAGPPAYECPRKKTIDCMPPVREEMRLQCSREYLEWVGRNCPDVRVVY